MRKSLPVSKRWRRVFAASSLLCMLTLVSISAGAQETSRFTIPFDFTVGKMAMPAGQYIVGKGVSPGLVLIQNVDGHHSATALASYAIGKVDLKKPELVFNQYGDQYFLSLVWSEGVSGWELPESRREREVKAARALATTWPSDWQKVVVLPN